MGNDPLAGLSELADVAAAVTQARAAVDRIYRADSVAGPGGRADSVQLPGPAECGLRTAVASAALAGSRYDVATVRTGTVTDPVVQGALRCAEALPGLVDRWRQAPRQVLARLHLLAARGVVDDQLLGRPAAASQRLDLLCDLVLRDAAPGFLRAAVVHGELLALRVFPGPYGVLARAAARLELVASGFDPGGLLPVDEGHLAREPEYVGAAGTFATGTPDGVRAWLRHCAAATDAAATDLADADAAASGAADADAALGPNG